ncbi:hypothetical protein D9Q98_001962 [Chlorella vulgaris]|uniref:uS12 prolyl 3,4-dihydroxylase n=1 Tax=Chlorella vulgaris TaxID=3077 RepID=A0A9D4TVL0_CHLVU|nr:hypothetical protein D9Q98_001962 [Chlorella vulgaris]
MTDEGVAVLRPGLLTANAQADLKAQYEGSQPYPHCVIQDFANPDLLRKVREEIITNVQATYKETDLFKMFQTGDLANLDALPPEQAAKLASVFRLRQAIYSPDFRSFISQVTGCGELSDQTDCACNVHAAGGHLLCHDDVIGNRRVSYIVYLTDPDDPWTAEDGGALELYPQAADTPHEPAVVPTATLLPVWNSLACFRVQPGRSFHSIQEVYTGDKPRMSIQGWFHAAQAPDNAELATRNQLQLRAGEDTAHDFKPFSGGSPAGELSAEDLAYLGQYVNPSYLSQANWAKVEAKFKEDGSVQLHNFLKPTWAQRVAAAVAAADAADQLGRGQVPAYTAGVCGGWQAAGPCHKQRYLRYSPDSTSTSGGGSHEGGGSSSSSAAAAAVGALLSQLQSELFASGAFAKLLRQLTTIGLVGQQAEVRRFRPGLDYTVAHYGLLTRDPQMDAVLCFVAGGEAGDGEAWESGEVGGYEAYLLADEDGEAAAVYSTAQDDETGVLNLSPAANTLNLVLRDEGLMRFVKFLSCQAPSSRFDIAATYLPEPDSDEEEEGEKGEEEA